MPQHPPSLPILRGLDILFSILGLMLAAPLLVVLALIGYFDTGSPFFRQQRVGRNQQPFVLIKFRTMRPGTQDVATHLADARAATRWGRTLRYSKLDELPQLWNVLKGEMSLVGPRPCLPSQTELIEARSRLGVFDARPGITGLAQLRGIDMSTPVLLAQTDAAMLEQFTVWDYIRYCLLTLTGQGTGDRIRLQSRGD